MIRSGTSFLAWVIAIVAAVVTIPTLWLATHVADESGYVDFTRPFVADSELRDALSAQIAADVVEQAGLPSIVQAPLEVAVRAVARRASQERGFTDAWDESQRRTHRLTFGDKSTDRLTVDIGPIASFVGERITEDLPVKVTMPDTLLVPVYDAPDRQVLDQVDTTPSRSRIGLLVVALASLLSVVLARRRVNALVGLGAGALITSGVLRIGTGLALPEVLDRTPASSPFARQMRDLLVDRAADSLNQWLLAIAVVGAVVLILALLARALPRR